MKKTFIILVIIFLINIPLTYYRISDDHYWTDQLMHFSGGFFTAMFFYYYLAGHLRAGTWFKNMVILVGTAALIGALWEFAEYLADQTIRDVIWRNFAYQVRFGGDLKDTLSDLFFDVFGAVSFCIFLHLLRRGDSHEIKG